MYMYIMYIYNVYVILINRFVKGIVSPLGCGVENTWQRLINSECGIVAIGSRGLASQYTFSMLHYF